MISKIINMERLTFEGKGTQAKLIIQQQTKTKGQKAKIVG